MDGFESQVMPEETSSQPRTISELQRYCMEKQMPLVRMRFFIGEDFKEPRAFGIYRDGDEFVVYKNKDTGARAVRYRGPDEAFAVNEIFQKLLSECHNRGIYPEGNSCGFEMPVSRGYKTKSNASAIGVGVALVALMGIIGFTSVFGNMRKHRQDGYYNDGTTYYYRYGDTWSYYDDAYSTWFETSFPYSDYSDYSIGDDYSGSWGIPSIQSSTLWDAWQDYYGSGSSYDSSSDSSWDSWDSGGTDWGSDW